MIIALTKKRKNSGRNTFTFIACEKKASRVRRRHPASLKLQLAVTFDPFCLLYASLIVNEIIFSRDDKKLLSVECIVRCKQLSIKLLDKSPASSSLQSACRTRPTDLSHSNAARKTAPPGVGVWILNLFNDEVVRPNC